MKKGKKSFAEQCQEKYPGFVESVEGLSVVDLEKTMGLYAKHREDTLIAKDKDEELDNAKKLAKMLGAPYSDALSALKDKLKYVRNLIKEKGGE